MEKLGELLGEAWTREQRVLDLIVDYGSIDGAHNKQWVLDQIVRILTGEEYEDFLEHHLNADGFEDWDVGVAP